MNDERRRYITDRALDHAGYRWAKVPGSHVGPAWTEEELTLYNEVYDKAVAPRRSEEAKKCTGCGHPRSSALKAVLEGHIACCPDCSTLTVAERNQIREGQVAAILRFCESVERLAEEKMQKTGKLEGAHYAAMRQLRDGLHRGEEDK